MREEFGLTMDVVMDPGERFGALYGRNDLFLVTDEDVRIVYERRYAPLADVRAAIEAELGD